LNLYKNRPFIKLLGGRLVTNIGDSLYAVAAMWLVQDLSHSTFYTGLAGFLTMFPQALQFLTGPIVDRSSNIKILLMSQMVQFVLVITIPVFYFLGILNLYWVLIVMPIVSFVDQFAFPAQSNLLPKLIPKEQLAAGNAWMSMAYQGADLVFNSMAGVLIGLIGAIYMYMLDSVTFILAFLLFMTIKVPNDAKKSSTAQTIREKLKTYFSSLKEGVDFVIKSVLKWLFIIAVIANFIIGMSFAVLPELADHICFQPWRAARCWA
jgi:hypothetical protein